jgi:hypothetical protein
MTKGRRALTTVLAMFVIGGLILLVPHLGLAQEKHKISWSVRPETTKTTVQHQLEIADVPSHIIRMFETKRTFPENPPTVENLKVGLAPLRILATYDAALR